MLKSFILFVFGYCIISNNLIALEQQQSKMKNVQINNDKKYNYKLQQNKNAFHLPPIKQDKIDNTIEQTEKKNLSTSNLNIKTQNNTDTTQIHNENIICMPKTNRPYKKYYNNTDWVCDNQKIPPFK